MCANEREYEETFLEFIITKCFYTRDILIRRSAYEIRTLSIPTVSFNTCSTTEEGITEDLVHEAGHVLGIVHPHLSETVMNYDAGTFDIAPGNYSHLHDENDCSPHPMDILAIYAQYQTLVD